MLDGYDFEGLIGEAWAEFVAVPPKTPEAVIDTLATRYPELTEDDIASAVYVADEYRQELPV